MQAAAEAERQETLELFQLEAKSFVEGIHERSGVEAENLRKRADDDVAAIREWSKQEIARIREETDQKITARKSELGEEIDDHAAAFAATEAAAGAADETDGRDAGDTAEARHDDVATDASNGVGPMDNDPRLSALGLVGFDEAEAEALADLSASDEEIPEIAD